MTIFRLHGKIITYVYADVEAENIDEAMEMFEELDGENFRELDDAEWELDKQFTLEYNKEKIVEET